MFLALSARQVLTKLGSTLTTMPAKKSSAKKAAKKAAKPATSVPAAKKSPTGPAKKEAARKAAKKLATKVVDGTPTAAAAKPSAPTAHRKSVPTKLKASEPVANPPSLQTIQEMAYLNYLHRTRHGLPGDAMSDWVAAVESLKQSDRSATETTHPKP